MYHRIMHYCPFFITFYNNDMIWILYYCNTEGNFGNWLQMRDQLKEMDIKLRNMKKAKWQFTIRFWLHSIYRYLIIMFFSRLSLFMGDCISERVIQYHFLFTTSLFYWQVRFIDDNIDISVTIIWSGRKLSHYQINCDVKHK